MTPDEAMGRINDECSHIWMVRTFLKHSPEAEEDEEVRDVHRTLYDYTLALGGSLAEGDAAQFLKLARKKYSKLKGALALFLDIQPDVSTHTNFQMAAASLKLAVEEIGRVLSEIN
jgi:hypothetical protein